jgi:hypothetical protein
MIRKLMELGVMVEPGAVEILEKGNTDVLIEKVLKMQPMPFTIDVALAKKLIIEPAKPKFLKKFTRMADMSVSDFVAGYNERYAALQRLLLKNPALSGAGSISSAYGTCCVIGVVKRKEHALEIDDPSGAKMLLTDRKDLSDGDVVGAVGAADENSIRASEIIFPGIQLKERAEASGTVTAGTAKDCAIRTDATALYEANGTLIAVSQAKLGKEEAAELLKRRHLTAPPKDFLEQQPDILVVNSAENFAENFKGVMLVGIKEGNNAEIDLAERTVRFV